MAEGVDGLFIYVGHGSRRGEVEVTLDEGDRDRTTGLERGQGARGLSLRRNLKGSETHSGEESFRDIKRRSGKSRNRKGNRKRR